MPENSDYTSFSGGHSYLKMVGVLCRKVYSLANLPGKIPWKTYHRSRVKVIHLAIKESFFLIKALQCFHVNSIDTFLQYIFENNPFFVYKTLILYQHPRVGTFLTPINPGFSLQKPTNNGHSTPTISI